MISDEATAAGQPPASAEDAELAGIELARELWPSHFRVAPASDAVYETLAESITRGYLPSGMPLSETAVAGWFDLSRTPIREALTRLEAEGLVERVPRRGVVVSRITTEEILEVYAARRIVDAAAVRLAATLAGPAERSQIHYLAEQVAEAADRGDFAAMSELNLEFHEMVATAGHNRILLRFARYLHGRVRRYPGTTFAVGSRAREAVDEHKAIVRAILAGDPDEAERVTLQHWENALKVRIQMISGASPDPGA